MPTVIKQCQWCGSPMETTRSSKRLDKSQCHTEYHRYRVKHGLTPKEGFAFIESELAEGRHPNHKHTINQTQEPQEDETH